MIRRLALVVALVLLLAFASWRQQSAPVTVTCGSATGGQLMTAQGVDWASRAGGWLRDIVDNPEEYRKRETVKETLDGIFRKVLWYWVKSGVQSARGEKIDPQILKLQEQAAQAEKDALAQCCPPPPPADTEDPVEPAEPPAEEPWDPRNASFQTGSGFTSGQLTIAAQADAERRRLGLPVRASVVILAAGFQESRVANLNYGDRDSIGWLQQRNAWGSRADRLNPTKAARMFYLGGAAGQRGLTDVRGWEQMSITRAVYSVQVSAYPNGAAQYEDDARRLLAASGGGGAPRVPSPRGEVTEPEAPGYTAGACAEVGETVSGSAGGEVVTAPGDWNFPGQRSVDAAIGWMRDQDQRNSGGWQARCLAAVGQAYGHMGTTPVAGHFYATGQWDAMPARYRSPGTGNPPRGALVFWDTPNVAGHIAISNGDGRVWTTDPPGRTGQIGLVDIDTIDTWGKRLGHGAPWFVGKTGAQA